MALVSLILEGLAGSGVPKKKAGVPFTPSFRVSPSSLRMASRYLLLIKAGVEFRHVQTRGHRAVGYAGGPKRLLVREQIVVHGPELALLGGAAGGLGGLQRIGVDAFAGKIAHRRISSSRFSRNRPPPGCKYG